MTEEDKNFIFEKILIISEIILNQSTILCELLDYPDDSVNISTRLVSLSEEVDQNIMELTLSGYEKKLINDNKDAIAFDIINRMLRFSRNLSIVGKSFVRYNIIDIKDTIISPIVDIEKSLKLFMEIAVLVKKDNNSKVCMAKAMDIRQIYTLNSNRYDSNMRALFENPTDALDVMRWKEIYASVNRVYVDLSEILGLLMKYLMFKN